MPEATMSKIYKCAAIALALTFNAHDVGAQTRPKSTDDALARGYKEIHGNAGLRFITGNSLQIEPYDNNHVLIAEHVLDENDIYGTAIDQGCPRIPRILTETETCGTDDYRHPVRCKPYRVFRKRRYTPIPPPDGSEIGFLVQGGPDDSMTRWNDVQPILRGDVTECASSPDPTPKPPEKFHLRDT
jgi:hypothetical protein